MTRSTPPGAWLVASPDGAAALLGWATARSAMVSPHVLPVDAIGSTDVGAPAVRYLATDAVPLPDALDAIGVLSAGVAVTLTLPLLDVLDELLDACAGTGAGAGAGIGPVRLDDVLVVDVGAVLLAEPPPGTAPASASGARMSDPARDLVTVCRAVWDRLDANDPARAVLDPVFAAAVDDPRAGRAALRRAIVGAAPPRPVRLDLVADPRAESAPPTGVRAGALGLLGRLADRGVPLGRSPTARRIPLRSLVTAVVVATGVVVAATALP